MSDGLQCPACEEIIEFADEAGNRSLSQLLGAGVSTAVADHTEEQLRKHLETHSIEDFVTALVMADRYIAVVEAERDEAVKWRREVEARVAAGPIVRPGPAYDARGGMPATLPPQFTPGPPPGATFGEDYIQPERRPRQHVDPEKTLIPHIPAGQRPEGVVGRRT